MKIKTIDLIAKEWFDKINGNSYFSVKITLNYGLKSVATFNLPMQYGYSDQYITESQAVLTEHNYISAKPFESLWQYCKRNNIILRTTKHENCLKRELTK